MDWNKIGRKIVAEKKPYGPYVNLEDLIRIQFRSRDFSFLPKQAVSSILSGRYASRLRGRGLNFEELRRYLPGDDIRTMDWKVSVRTQKPHVRVYSEERDRSLILLVDQRQNMFFGTNHRFKSVTAAEVAALGAWRGNAVGDRVGAVVFNDTEIREFPARNSKDHVMSILGAITEMNNALPISKGEKPNPDKLKEALAQVARLAKHDALVVIISDCYGVDQEVNQLVTRIAEHNDILGVLTYDKSRESFVAEKVTLSDGDRQMEVDFSKESVRQKLKEDYEEEENNIANHLKRLSAPLFMVHNEEDVVKQIRSLLGRQKD